jgi:hypothetical protein
MLLVPACCWLVPLQPNPARKCDCHHQKYESDAAGLVCYIAVTLLTSVSVKMRPGIERRGMSAFKGVVASTDHFDSTFQAAADTNGVALAIRRASAHWHVKDKSLS